MMENWLNGIMSRSARLIHI